MVNKYIIVQLDNLNKKKSKYNTLLMNLFFLWWLFSFSIIIIK